MKFVKVAQKIELSMENKLKVSAGDKTILLVNVDGSYYAIENRCPHMGGSLFSGNLEGENIVCPRHGAIFNVKTGKNVGAAKILFLKTTPDDAKIFPVKVEGEDILVGIE